ncbi:MAG: AI-2E family transporter [Gemmatimonadales bacterium]
MTSRSTSLSILAAIAVTAALYLGQEVFVPIALGLMMTALVRPLVQLLSRIHVPDAVGATLVTLGILGMLAAGGYFVAGPLKGWVRDAPQTLSAARGKIQKLRRPIKQVSQVVEKAKEEVTGGGQEKQGQKEDQKTQAPAPAGGSFLSSVVGPVFATTAGILSTLLQTIVIVFVVLATGDLLSRKLALLMPPQKKGTPEETVAEAESVVRRYLVVTLLLSGGQAVVVALVFTALGVPSPILWGVLTFLLECLPYIGALIMVGLITIASFAAFDSIGQIVLPPLAYITISSIQNNLVSPFAYGSGLRLNPLAVLIIVIIGWFLWGPAGAFVAVPLLAAARVFAERSSTSSRLAEVLSD